MDHKLIQEHFPNLSAEQLDRFKALGPLYQDWNGKINLISRKDIEQLYLKHVLHSLGIAKVMPFARGSRILDIGTGGGFPGIPLAILFPECQFVLIDSIGKKIKVVNEVASALGLSNVQAAHVRADEHKGKYDFVVSRAVTRLSAFIPWTRNKFTVDQKNAFPNGILYLKGGDLKDELKEVREDLDVYDLSKWFNDPFFETKKVIYVRMV